MSLNPASLSPLRATVLGIILVVLGTLAAFWFTLAHISLTGAEAGGFSNITRSGAIVNATFTFTNDGLFAVELENIEYTATLADGTTLAKQERGAGGTIRTDRPNPVTVEIPIAWEPSAQLAARLLAGGNTTITIEGVATVGAGPFSHDVPFQTTIDARDYLRQFLPQNQNDILGAVLGLFE